METDYVNVMMKAENLSHRLLTVIEAKRAKIPKSFSIENLIAEKSASSRDSEEIKDAVQNSFEMPSLALPPNFPAFNPWAANYLMSQTNLCPNLLLNANPHLQGEKLTNFMDTQANLGNGYKDKFSELLLQGSFLPRDQLTTYLHQQHPPDPSFLSGKMNEPNFLNDFYNNYFLTENNRMMMSATQDNNAIKRSKKCREKDTNDNSTSSDQNNLSNDFEPQNKAETSCELNSSYNDMSVAVSPSHSRNLQDEGTLMLF